MKNSEDKILATINQTTASMYIKYNYALRRFASFIYGTHLAIATFPKIKSQHINIK